jgi:predicted double-glycine peptidase
MLRTQILKTTCALTALVLLIYFSSYALAQSENVISLEQIRPDKACGPRCLSALMQITKVGTTDCGIKCIYEIINKEPFCATSLKDMKNAAEQLGFSAKGYKLKISDLKKIAGYAILPIGNTTGTAGDPLHFILVKRVIKDYIIVVNTKNLVSQAIQVSDLQQYWNGYALVITSGKGMKRLNKEPDDVMELRNKSNKYDEIKDFGQVDSGSKLKCTFTLLNKTDSQYKAKIVQKSCSCLTTKLGRDIKGRPTLTVELHVDKPAWQEAHAVVLLEPDGIIKRYAVRAYGRDSFQITPQVGYFEAPNGDIVEYPVRIDYFTGASDLVEFDHMESDIQNLKVGLPTSKVFTEKDTKTYKFEIPLIYNAEKEPVCVRTISGKVNFILDTTEGQRSIPLKLSVKFGVDKFRLIPEKVFIMASKSAEPTSKTVKLEFLTKVTPTNIVARLDDTLPFESQIRQIYKGCYRIDLTVIKEKLRNNPIGMHKSKITIVPKGVPNIGSVSIPISLFVYK